MIITHHECTFEIDTSDWTNQSSAEKCAGYLEDLILSWDADQTLDNWCALVLTADGEASAAEERVDAEIQEAAMECAGRVFSKEKWLSVPDVGHNAFIAAVRDGTA